MVAPAVEVVARCRLWMRDRPRWTTAVGFGATAAAISHFSWIPEARFSGAVPLVTLSASLAHAAGGALAGVRLMDPKRTRTAAQAGILGAWISLGASALFSAGFALWIASSSANFNLLSYVALVPLVGFFSFLSGGWALLVGSIGVGWGVYHLAQPNRARSLAEPAHPG